MQNKTTQTTLASAGSSCNIKKRLKSLYRPVKLIKIIHIKHTGQGSSMTQRLLNFFNIQRGEGQIVGLMIIYSAFIGVSISYFYNASTTLFLAQFSSEMLPYTFILSALVLTGGLFLYRQAEARLSSIQVVIASLIFLALSVLILRLILETGNSAPLVFAALVWFRLFPPILFIGFWSIANQLFDIGQGKRLFSFIGLGVAISGIAANLPIPFIVKTIGVTNLYLIVDVSLVICLVLVVIIAKQYKERFDLSEQAEPTRQAQTTENNSVREILGNRYIQLIFLLYIFGWVFSYLLDFTYFDSLQNRFLDNQEGISAFIGLVSGLSAAVELIAKSFISGRILTRYGIRVGLLALPIVVSLTSVSAIAMGVLHASEIFFWLVVSTKFSRGFFRNALDEPSTRILYQPLPPQQRTAAISIVEGFGASLVAVISGSILLLFAITNTFSVLNVIIFMAIIGILWAFSANAAFVHYARAIQQVLTHRTLTGEVFLENDATTIKLLHQKLESDKAGDVIYALEFLERLGEPVPNKYYEKLIQHPVTEVRFDVLERIEKHRSQVDKQILLNCVETDPTPKVQSKAIQVYCLLYQENLIDVVQPYLENSNKQVHEGIIIGLFLSNHDKNIQQAEKLFTELLNSSECEDHVRAAKIIAKAKDAHNANFSTWLSQLLADKTVKVKQEAVLAAGQLNDSQFWPTLIRYLDTPKIATSAVSALFIADESVYDEFERAFHEKNPSRKTLRYIAQICGRRQDDRAIKILADNLLYPDELVRGQILASLSHCDYQADENTEAIILEAIEHDVEETTWLLNIYIGLDKSHKASQLLQRELENHIEQIRRRLFRMLSLMYDTQLILDAEKNLQLQAQQKRAYALEILEITLPQSLKNLCLPILARLPAEETYDKLKNRYPQPERSHHEHLAVIISQPDNPNNNFLKCYTLYAIGQFGEINHYETVLPTIQSLEGILRETGAWAIHQLDATRSYEYLQQLQQDQNPQVVQIANHAIHSGGNLMLLTIEKILILKEIKVFANLPDHLLTEVAMILEEIKISAGEMLFHEGDPGDSMYILVSGKARVETASYIVAELEENSIIGDMALFDEEPRSASVKAITDLHLLRLDEYIFIELMETHPEIAQGFISIMIERLRTVSHEKHIAPEIGDALDSIINSVE